MRSPLPLFIWTSGLSLLLGLGGCSHDALDRVNSRLDQDREIADLADLDQSVHSTIEQAAGLTPDQRTHLQEIQHHKIQSEREINEESLKLQALLIEDLTGPRYVDDDIQVITDRLEALARERQALLSDSLLRSQEVLGVKRAVHRRAQSLGDYERHSP